MDTDGLNATEAECAAGRTAPRVSLDDIKANIAGEFFNTADQMFAGAPVTESMKTLTICILALRNGFTIIGKSAPADARNFDPVLGQKLAYEDAVRQVWPLMGYELRERLYQGEQGREDPVVPALTQDLDGSERPTGREPIAAFEPGEGMVRHIGTKIVDARPMTRADYNRLRGWELPADEHGADEGYLVEYTDRQQEHVPGFRGYVSWSPKAVFDLAYIPV